MPDPVTLPDVLPAERLDEAAAMLRRGELVGFPTETVYGVAAVAEMEDATGRLRRHAGLDPAAGLTWHVPDADAALALLPEASGGLRRLVRKLLPGPVTLRVGVGGAWVSVRCPDQPLTRRLLRSVGAPVVGASAARPGGRVAVDAEDAAAALLGTAGAVLDGGRCRFGKPSTLLELRDSLSGGDPGSGGLDWSVRRRGVIDERMIAEMQKVHWLLVCTGNTCRSPMAEVIARDALRGKPEVHIGSAGVYAGEGQPASPEAVEAVRPLGLDLSAHRSRPLTADLIASADFVFTMTESHRRAVLAQAPH
ncbi:MAG: Sua5/YciO/YrdC/YwlC family protein, partial [Planctomycetota bacterium]